MDETSYPAWVRKIVESGAAMDDGMLMRAAIRVALANIQETGGGPFGAIVATAEGRVVSVGYNLVVPAKDSTAHAEVVAIRRAESTLDTFRLRGPGIPSLKLFTTCAPCVMCAGAIHWAGVPKVIAAARAADAEAIGFIEGPRSFDVAAFLRERGIEYVEDFVRDDALEIFRRYSGSIYNG